MTLLYKLILKVKLEDLDLYKRIKIMCSAYTGHENLLLVHLLNF